jgi:hypothetical protein
MDTDAELIPTPEGSSPDRALCQPFGRARFINIIRANPCPSVVSIELLSALKTGAGRSGGH